MIDRYSMFDLHNSLAVSIIIDRIRAGFTMGQMGQLPRAPTNFTKLGGPHHKDNEIDLFRIVDFF